VFKRILVPLDGSGQAERVLPIAARLARASGGSVILVRVISTDPAHLPTAPTKPMLDQTVGGADQTQAESYLRAVAGSELLSGISVQIHVPVGAVPASILAIAANEHADIIVMSSHGETGVRRWWLLGSVAAKVARFAEVPVFVLREGGPLPKERHPGERPLRVLVPLDGSDEAKAALEPAAYLAATLATPGQGALHLVYVVKPARKPQHTQADQNVVREYLEAMVRRLRDGSENPAIAKLNLEITSSVIIDDDIDRGITRAAENGGKSEGNGIFEGSDVIAMTTHGSNGLQPWVGSVIERVLYTTRLPLLIVRPRK
jgi:nucleotide-binding universal stress UspA family protein